MRNISKKRITLGTKQYVPMFEQFLNESEEMEDEDMEMEEPRGGEDEEMEEEEMEGSESGEESEEVEERIQEAYRRGLAKGKRLPRINEAADPSDVERFNQGEVAGFKNAMELVALAYSTASGKTAKVGEDFKQNTANAGVNTSGVKQNVLVTDNGKVNVFVDMKNIHGTKFSIGDKSGYLGNFIGSHQLDNKVDDSTNKFSSVNRDAACKNGLDAVTSKKFQLKLA